MVQYVVSCAAGFEMLVENEVKLMGGRKIYSEIGVVTWEGTLEQGYRCCLWSRYSSRIFLVLQTFQADDTDKLYDFSRQFSWQDHLDSQQNFAINCTLSGDSKISHSRYAALKVKDGLVDYFRDKTGGRPSVQVQQPDIQFHVHIKGQTAQLLVDLSGESLHRRGYRVATGTAPLKETLAAAIVGLSGWIDEAGVLVDPMCGSGTLLVEAALMYGDSAPGLSRNYFGFLGWIGHEHVIWENLVQEAVEREEQGIAKKWPLLIGYDCDPVAVSSARKNIARAGLEDFIQIKQGEVASLRAAASSGMVLSNLPYGERLSEKEMVKKLYSGLGRILRQNFSGWKCAVFISNPELTDSFGLSWEKKHRLYNGSINCSLLVGSVGKPAEPFVWRLSDISAENFPRTGEFANRLKKNLKKVLKWAVREDVRCFRVYDRDLPDYNFTIDFYGKWVHVQEYAPPKSIDPETARSRMDDGIKTIKDLLGVRSNRVFVKRRERQRGRKQYEKKSDKKKMYEVVESDASLLVNFTDYIDTGLFLDHRPLRQTIARCAGGKRFLNLFGYTGAATIQAALGGAQSTTTVDLSATYVNWTKLNLALNGLAELNHRVEQSDCMEWLKNSNQKFDLIFIDPPTFSNTKKQKRVFDVQRDHKQLIVAAMRKLDLDGTLYFSTNYTRFKIDEQLPSLYDVVDISKKTIPFDYSRNPKIHYGWEMKHKGRGIITAKDE